MATYLVLRTGHQYRVADSLTLAQVNDALNTNPDRFVSVPLHPDAATVTGTPGLGQTLTGLFITPGTVSHFYSV